MTLRRVGRRTFVEPLGPEEAVMPATPSLANVILGGIAASLVAAQLFVGVGLPSTSTDDPVADLLDNGHAHKGDRLALFHAQGPSVTVAAPSVALFGVTETKSGTRPNTSVALKNVVVVARVIDFDFDASTAPDPRNGAVPTKQDPVPAPKAMSCKVLAEPKLALGRVGIRCFA
jgi:hypothetical protein